MLIFPSLCQNIYHLGEFDDLFGHPPAHVLWVLPAAESVLTHHTPHPEPVGQPSHHPLQVDKPRSPGLSGTVWLGHESAADLAPEGKEGVVVTSRASRSTGSYCSTLQYIGPGVEREHTLLKPHTLF